jgi:hypothetical protein
LTLSSATSEKPNGGFDTRHATHRPAQLQMTPNFMICIRAEPVKAQ